MSTTKKSINQETLNANIEVHSALANAGEYDKSPHFRPENKAKVRNVLTTIVSKLNRPDGVKLLDLGCGTGFVLHIVSPFVKEAHGVDITDDMMAQVDLSLGNIYLKKSAAEDTGFDSESFDVVTAYSFLDHLYDYTLVLEEAYRVLNKGGVFYSDLNPNRQFSQLMMNLEEQAGLNNELPVELAREIKGMLHNGELYSEQFGISKDTLTKAEPQKSYSKGFESKEVISVAKKIGFSNVSIEFNWFLGQGVIMNSDESLNIQDIDSYLHKILPTSEPFFKYLRFVFVK